MGDRANIVIRDGAEQVVLYGHWSGETYIKDAQTALAKKWRWDYPPYLARIVYDVFVGESAGDETGFGIWPSRCDNEYPILVIDTGKQRVYFEDEKPEGTSWARPSEEAAKGWTFAEFVALKELPNPRADRDDS